MSSTLSESNTGFATGFVSALIFLAAFTAAVRVAEWVSAHRTPDAVIAWLAAPRISVLEVVNLAVLLVIGYAVLWTLAFGPRFR